MSSEQNIQDVLEELKKDQLNTELIQDNKLPFDHNGLFYRISMPSQRDNSQATNYKNKRYIQLVQEDNTLTIKQLTKLLKEKQNIDIEEMDKEAKTLEDKMTQLYLSLSQKKDNDIKGIEKLKTELDVVRDKRLEIVLEKAEKLAPAIENQAHDDYYRFLTAMCTYQLLDEKNDEWCKVWKTFDDYQKDNSKLSYLALGKTTELIYGA